MDRPGLQPHCARELTDLSLVNWFEHEKSENGISGLIDWRATVNPEVRAALLQTVSSGYIFARDP